jgi:hypothetical protein
MIEPVGLIVCYDTGECALLGFGDPKNGRWLVAGGVKIDLYRMG